MAMMVSRTTLCLVVSVVICFVLFVTLSGERSVFPGSDSSLNIADINLISENHSSQTGESKSEVEVDTTHKLETPEKLKISFILKVY